jgi:hypothetical protein
MKTEPEKTPVAGAWRGPLTMGLAIGVGVPLARFLRLEQALGLGVGSWGAVLMNAAVAGLVGGVVAAVAYGLLRRVGRRPA